MSTKGLPGPPWTILATLQWTSHYFKQLGIESHRAAAEILLAYGLGCRRLDLYLRHDKPLNTEELSGYKVLIKRRAAGEPVAYITGRKEFWSLDFVVNPSVLIPRPETEGLVETALEFLQSGSDGYDTSFSKHNVLELGTGSGAVVIALAKEIPQDIYWATELSMDALSLACINAQHHLPAGKIRFLVGCWFEPLRKSIQCFDFILSNPPYIPTDEIGRLAPEVRLYEPCLALDGGPDGLREIKRIIDGAPYYLKPGGLLLMEIGHNQFPAVKAHGQRTGAYDRIESRKDYAGYDRIVCLRKIENPR